MRRLVNLIGAVALGAAAILNGDVASAAAPAIKCSASAQLVQRTAAVTIESNRPIRTGQTSLVATYIKRDHTWATIKMDAGYGSLIHVRRPADSRGWRSFQTWHAGTKCRTLLVVSGL